MNNESETNLQFPSKKKSSRIGRMLVRIVISLFILFALILTGAFMIGYYYQNEVKSYVISELNKQLNTEIIVDGEDIDFTVLKNFPYSSVDFKNVKAMDATESNQKDTLFKAQSISLQFNIVDVFQKNYHIKKIEIDDANLKIRIDKKGNDNYHFWKASAQTDTAAFAFALEEIVLKQVRISYKNNKNKQSISLLINKSILSGDFSDEKYSLKTESDLVVNSIKTNGEIFFRKKNIHAELAFEVNSTIQSYKIQKGKIKIENLLFEVVGNVIDVNELKQSVVVNLGIRSQNMDIQSVLSLIPNQYKERINDYKSTGEFYFDATVKGSVSDNNIPLIVADFGIKNAEITQIKDNIVLTDVYLKGHYSNGNKGNQKSSVFELRPFSVAINQGSISGNLFISNLNDPTIEADIKANISLEELQKFIKIDTIETITGQLKMNALFKGKWEKVNYTTYEDISNKGNLLISDMNVKLKNNALNFNNINGDFDLNNNDLIVNKLTGNVSNSDFELNGIFKNTVGFILKENQDITVEATLKSKNINLNELLANKEEDSKSTSKYKLKFSEHINVNLASDIQHVSFRKFEATNIKGAIILKDKKMMADPIKFSTMNGNIIISGLVDGSDSTKLGITCVSDVNNINVTKLFTAFENFTQSSITDQNIKGLLTAKIQFASELSPELTMDMSKLVASIDMTIENGELNNVEAMKNLSRYIELKELNAIRFATLKNSFEIKNRVLTFPKMEIKSTAMNINLSGSHTFNNEINYKIKLSLNELLTKKIRKTKKEDTTFGELADDGLGRTNIFLTMTGTVDNPIIKYDAKGAIQNIKSELKEEKSSIKTILKEEFGFFKKDTTLKAKNKSEDQKIIIKWDEENEKEEKKVLKMPKKKEEEDF